MMSQSEQEPIIDKGCGKYFFHFLPMVVGVCYGLFERGVILKTWWMEAAIAALVILLMQVLFHSWLYVNCRQEIPEIKVTPSVQRTCFFIGTVTAGFIYVFAVVVILIKWVLGVR